MLSSPNYHFAFIIALALSPVLCGCDGKVGAQGKKTEVRAVKDQAVIPVTPPPPVAKPDSTSLDPKKREQLVKLLDKLIAKEHGERALVPLSTLLQAEPNNVEFLSLRAQILLSMAEEERARADLDKGLFLDPTNFELNSCMADYLSVAGNNKSARKCLELCLKARPKDARILGQLGALSASEGRYQQGADYYGKAAEIDKKNPMWKRKQAYCYWGKKDYPKAMQLLQSCRDIHKDDLESYQLQAELYLKLGDVDKALNTYRDLFKQFPSDHHQRRPYALALMKAKQYDEAISVFSKMLELSPEDEELYSARASAYLGKNQLAKAMRDVEESIRISPRENAEAYRVKDQIKQAMAEQGKQNLNKAGK